MFLTLDKNDFQKKTLSFCKKCRNKSPSLRKTQTWITIYNNKDNISYKF